jgi:DNA-binding transcriptional LysR family regulator
MTLQQFRVLDAIATSGNLSRAALELSTSQPALSHQLKLLQLSYGAKLYSRTPAGIVLTDAGERLLAGIRPILKSVDKLKKGSVPVIERKFASMVLRTGGTFSACAVLLPTLLARLQLLHHEARFECRTSTSEQLERSVINRKMDVAVTARAATSRELACEPLRSERIVAFVPSGHPLARKKSLTGPELFNETLIIRGGTGISGTTEKALRRFRTQGSEIKIGLRCDDPMAIRAAVRQKMGVGVAFEETIKADAEGGEFKILKVRGLELAGASFIVYSKQRQLSPIAQEFLELLRASRSKQHAISPSTDHQPHMKKLKLTARSD